MPVLNHDHESGENYGNRDRLIIQRTDKDSENFIIGIFFNFTEPVG